MRNDLIQTSSIFSRNKNTEDTAEQVVEALQEDTIEREAVKYCKVIDFKENSQDAKISLETFFPDSMFCILHNKHSDAYFAGHMKQELIFEVPIKSYSIILVTTEMVVLSVALSGDDGEELAPTFMILEAGGYKLEDSFQPRKVSTEIVYNGKEYTMVTSEIKAPEVNTSSLAVTYFYEEGKFIHCPTVFLVFENAKANVRLLLADNNGSYIGYYLPMNIDGSINLHGRSCHILQRLTLTLVVVVETESAEVFFLTCGNQMLVAMEDFHSGLHTDIPVMNGVAMLFDNNSNSYTLNVFTPNHQRIVLEPKYKIDYMSFGNGVHFPKDNVLLLDNGSLIFTQPVAKNVVSIRGQEINIPVKHLGDL